VNKENQKKYRKRIERNHAVLEEIKQQIRLAKIIERRIVMAKKKVAKIIDIKDKCINDKQWESLKVRQRIIVRFPDSDHLREVAVMRKGKYSVFARIESVVSGGPWVDLDTYCLRLYYWIHKENIVELLKKT